MAVCGLRARGVAALHSYSAGARVAERSSSTAAVLDLTNWKMVKALLSLARVVAVTDTAAEADLINLPTFWPW